MTTQRFILFDDVLARTGRRERTIEAPGGLVPFTALEAIAAGYGCATQDLVFLRDGLEILHGGGDLVATGSAVIVAPRVRDPGTAIMIVIAVASALISAALARTSLPRISTGEEAERRYVFSRFANDAFVGEAIAVPYGRRRRAGGKVVAKVPVEASDGSGDSKLKLLICMGWGTSAGIQALGDQTADFNALAGEALTGFTLNDQPITNFRGVRVWGRLGTTGQAAIPGFSDVETLREIGVGGVTLRNTDGVERTGGSPSAEAFSFTTGSINGVVPRIRLPGGLYDVAPSGQVDPQRVKYRYRWRLVAGSWSAWTVVTLDRAEQSEFFSSPRLDTLVAGAGAPVEVQLERVSVEPESVSVVDTLVWDSIVEVLYSSETYAGFAMLAVELTAGEQLTGVPRVGADRQGRKIRVWDGVSSPSSPTFVTEYSENPAYQVLDLLTSTSFGLGVADAKIDMASLIAWAEYCDEAVALLDGLGGTRPRFACHLDVDEQRDAIEWIRTIAATGRCTPAMAGDLWRFPVDRPQATAVETFTDRDIQVEETERGPVARFAYHRDLSKGGLRRPNRLTCQFENELEDGQPDVIGYPEYGAEWLGAPDNEPVREEAVELAGVTHPEQVLMELWYRLKRIRAYSRSVRFTTTRPFVVTQPGDRFDLAFSLPGWGTSGGIQDGSTTTSVIIDRTVTLTPAIAYTIRVTHEDGTVEDRAVSSPAGTYAAGTAIAVGAAFATAPQEFESYALGASGVHVKPFTCEALQLVDADTLTWEIDGVEYDAGVYDPSPGDVDLPDYSDLDSLITPPGPLKSLSAFDRTVAALHVVELAWTQELRDAEITGHFVMFRRRTGTSAWVLVTDAKFGRRGAVLEIAEEDAGYEFIVVAVSLGGSRLSEYDPRHPIASVVFGLAEDPPPPPGGLTLTNVGGNTYTLSWTAVDGAVGYQVLTGGDTTTKPNVGAEDCLVLARTVDPELPGLELPPSQACRFFVRSIGANGRMSFTASTINIASPATPAGESIVLTKVYDLNAEGTKTNLTYDSGQARLELTDANDDGVWESPEQDLGSLATTELTIRPATANDAADPVMSSFNLVMPSIAADQWGLLETTTDLVGMLFPPYPDAEHTWVWEVKTYDGAVWTDYAALATFASVRTSFSKYRLRATMRRVTAPYRPALRGLTVVCTR